MNTYLQIAGDPTMFELTEPLDVSTVTEATAPLRVSLASPPSAGTLILNPDAAGTITLFTEAQETHGVIPTDGDELTSYLYLPSSGGLTTGSLGHQLDGSGGTADLAASIAGSMSGDPIQVGIISDGLPGTLVLNGALLPFAVLYQTTTPLGT